jgi:hypothetical protein
MPMSALERLRLIAIFAVALNTKLILIYRPRKLQLSPSRTAHARSLTPHLLQLRPCTLKLLP